MVMNKFLLPVVIEGRSAFGHGGQELVQEYLKMYPFRVM